MTDLATGLLLGFTLGMLVALVLSGAWRELRPRDRADLRHLHEHAVAMERLSGRRRSRPSQRLARRSHRTWS